MSFTVRKIRVENGYSDGHESTIEYDVNVTASPATTDLTDESLEAMWDLLWEYTGDGHGIGNDLGWSHTITILDASDPRLVGLSYENSGN